MDAMTKAGLLAMLDALQEENRHLQTSLCYCKDLLVIYQTGFLDICRQDGRIGEAKHNG
jgi:hypothetical protein